MSVKPEAVAPTTAVSTAPPPPVSLFEAFGDWLRLRFLSFNGPAWQIAIVHMDLVERRR